MYLIYAYACMKVNDDYVHNKPVCKVTSSLVNLQHHSLLQGWNHGKSWSLLEVDDYIKMTYIQYINHR